MVHRFWVSKAGGVIRRNWIRKQRRICSSFGVSLYLLVNLGDWKSKTDGSGTIPVDLLEPPPSISLMISFRIFVYKDYIY